jgi:hypothetical protein
MQQGKIVASGPQGWARAPWEKLHPSVKWTLDKQNAAFRLEAGGYQPAKKMTATRPNLPLIRLRTPQKWEILGKVGKSRMGRPVRRAAHW